VQPLITFYFNVLEKICRDDKGASVYSIVRAILVLILDINGRIISTTKSIEFHTDHQRYRRDTALMAVITPSIPIALVMQLAVAHAPQVAPETIAAFAKAESNLNPYAIFDNTARRSYTPSSAQEAVSLARDLLDQGHFIDAGLMQINSGNFSRTGLSADTAFDPGQSVRAGAQILVGAYRACQERQPASDPLRCMASVYNTGKPVAGERNGYVARLWAVADHVVPAIRQAVPAAPSPVPEPQTPALPNACGPPPPSWDGWAVADYQSCLRRTPLTPAKPEQPK
jgi:type IV secretion system protein VirB1